MLRLLFVSLREHSFHSFYCPFLLNVCSARFRTLDPTKPPPPNYICRRCNIPGHFIQFCPARFDPSLARHRTSGTFQPGRFSSPAALSRLDRITGTASSQTQFLGYVENSDEGSVQLLWSSSSPASEGSSSAAVSALVDPLSDRPDLRCPLCSQPFRDAVIVPCCAKTYCNECICQALVLENKCPTCSSSIDLNKLKPNSLLQNVVDSLLAKASASSSSSSSSSSGGTTASAAASQSQSSSSSLPSSSSFVSLSVSSSSPSVVSSLFPLSDSEKLTDSSVLSASIPVHVSGRSESSVVSGTHQSSSQGSNSASSALLSLVSGATATASASSSSGLSSLCNTRTSLFLVPHRLSL